MAICVMQTVANLARQGCHAVIPIILAIGLGAAIWAARFWWKSSAVGYETLQDAQTLTEP